MAISNKGSCLCGAVRFTASGPLRGVIYCHCSQCRKQSGHYYAATNVAIDDLAVEGCEKITWYEASTFAKRGFCSVCGSALFWKRNEADEISVMAGAFEQPSGLKAEAHIFVADKGDYYTIDDGLPRFERSTPAVSVAED
ncbi:MAG: GFA family protein [Pseudomonadota bacterium]|nr:GFA family protein [Pseudomonadota bacterium]MDQ2704045.1 GFA family protein [Pseudomonadota bacterium]